MSILLEFANKSVGKEAYFLLAGTTIKGLVKKVQGDAATVKVVEGEGKDREYLLHYSQLIFLIATA